MFILHSVSAGVRSGLTASLVRAALRRAGLDSEWQAVTGIAGDQEKQHPPRGQSGLRARVSLFRASRGALLINLLLSGVIAELRSCRSVCKEEFLSF